MRTESSDPPETRESEETILDILALRFNRYILPTAGAAATIVLFAQWIWGVQGIRLAPVVFELFLIGATTYSIVARGHRAPLPLIVLVLCILALCLLSFSSGSFRTPGGIALRAVTIIWVCLFTRPRFSILFLFLLLGIDWTMVLLIARGIIHEKPPTAIELQMTSLTVLYGMVFVSTMIPLRALFDAVRKSMVAERTARKALEQLQETRAFTIQAVDHSRQFFGWMTTDGTIQYVNSTALALVDADSVSIVGRKIWDTPWFSHDPQEQAKVRDAVGEASNGQVVRFETGHVSSRGKLHIVDFALHPIRDGGGAITLLVAEGRDITDEREAVRQKERLAGQIQQSQKLDALGRLAGGVAHDFNNALTAIMGSADLLASGASSPEESREYISTIQASAKNARELTRKLLNFSRKETISDRQILDIRSPLQDTVAILRRIVDRRVAIELEVPTDECLVMGNAGLVQNALTNLGINAWHAMPEGGTLTFSVRDVELDVQALSASPLPAPPGRYLELAVRDTGCGMPPEILEHVFEPFFSTKAPDKGTGLGLATVYGTMKEHGGTILVDSKPGEGTTFRLYLPKAVPGTS